MTSLRSLGFVRCFFVGAIWISILALLICENASMADEVPAFFLKIAKNIPRVGRSEGYDDFFKSRKNLPKLGNHDGQSESWPQYSVDEPFSRPIKRRVDYPSVDDWSWQHFPLAIEGPRELWRTLAGYSKDTSDDVDNEIWKRKKRTGNEPMASEEN
ncbi:ecdysis triggering hormone preproprotein [Apis mellifera caucasica]|uniref:Ecdysis triggering hormone preproprotein n=1 Tax=Apis mellifera TaxID=7460 RepID=A0A8U0WQI4_APIME|nr:ecdysis triggering hormone preproprotein [Apis mellifera]KAG6802554.1 ecdysis triggering hormone preproprotein [Apis mellifera caucasica]BAG80963.1 ecdysis triggering hormone preprotein [Apis mellifera]|eukprot:NP_001136079.1 ecdysis triggering hormone preproprotein [Apis mellifera]